MISNDTRIRAERSQKVAGAPSAAPRTLGAILIAAGRLDLAGAKKILDRQRVEGLSFGQAAISLGLLTEADVELGLARQFDSAHVVTGNSALSDELVTAYEPFGAQAEALRVLRAELMQRWFKGPGKHALAITSAPPRIVMNPRASTACGGLTIFTSRPYAACHQSSNGADVTMATAPQMHSHPPSGPLKSRHTVTPSAGGTAVKNERRSTSAPHASPATAPPV